MKASIIHNPHDKLFRASLQYSEVAREFLEMYLPAEIKNDIDLNKVSYCNTSFIDEQLKLTQSDVLFKTTIDDKAAYIYILAEHQFKVDKLMPFRLMKYMGNIWDFHLRQSDKKNSLPLLVIYPLVFYTGESPYHGSRVLSKLFGEQKVRMQHILDLPFHLSNEILKIVDNLNTIGLNKQGQYVVELVKYILNIDDDHRNVAEFVGIMHDRLLPSVEEEIMTLAERIEEKGRLDSKVEIAKAMLDAGSDPAFIVKVTKLPLTKIKELQKSTKIKPKGMKFP